MCIASRAYALANVCAAPRLVTLVDNLFLPDHTSDSHRRSAPSNFLAGTASWLPHSVPTLKFNTFQSQPAAEAAVVASLLAHLKARPGTKRRPDTNCRPTQTNAPTQTNSPTETNHPAATVSCEATAIPAFSGTFPRRCITSLTTNTHSKPRSHLIPSTRPRCSTRSMATTTNWSASCTPRPSATTKTISTIASRSRSRNVGQEDFEAVGQGGAVVLIFLGHGAGGFDDFLRALYLSIQ